MPKGQIKGQDIYMKRCHSFNCPCGFHSTIVGNKETVSKKTKLIIK
eukprot:SAG31_NODE_44031_length_264_cov_1.127273_1_plen_45_part_01